MKNHDESINRVMGNLKWGIMGRWHINSHTLWLNSKITAQHTELNGIFTLGNKIFTPELKEISTLNKSIFTTDLTDILLW